MKAGTAFFCTMIVALWAAPPALSSELLSSMKGSWIGNGWVKRNPGGPRETVRCRITNHYVTAGRRLVVSGKCAVPGKKFELKGTVSANLSGTRISGRWSNPFGIGSTSVEGTLFANQAFLDFKAPLDGSKKPVRQQMIWQKKSRGFTITNQLSGTGQSKLGSIEFEQN